MEINTPTGKDILRDIAIQYETKRLFTLPTELTFKK